MNLAQIELNLQQLADNPNDKDNFVYDLLLAYDTARSTLSRLRNGTLNKAKQEGDVVWKANLFFRPVLDSDQLQDAFELMQLSEPARKYQPRFIIATDFETILALDTKTAEKLDAPIKELHLNAEFFRPWAGVEKYIAPEEARADVKAADRMARLYEQLNKDNPTTTPQEVHVLNIFLTRLLFCYFAEDTGIFEDKLFAKTVALYTSADSCDTSGCISQIFDILNVQKRGDDTPAFLAKFPFVNGGLFREKYPIPKFTARSRRLLLDGSKLDWSEINPDIFGSMIQAVTHSDQRGGLGMHYTSVPNIMKVIEPLFLNDLKEEFEKQKRNLKGLYRLLNRISRLKIFDPACGSGNFLIIAYKELRKLEMEIFKQIMVLTKQPSLSLSGISLTQFYGIELDDFAHEVAILSLWLAEHQMNTLFRREFGRAAPPLPLKESGNIVCGNATRVNWQQVCPRTKEDEVYILGNPPYLGGKLQNEQQKEDLDFVSTVIGRPCKNLDYIACWFILGTKYIEGTNSKYAFVTTNSICQGEQVELLWPYIFEKKLEISFAYLSFKWSNNAKGNAGVTCAIIGIRNTDDRPKYIFSNGVFTVKNINGYLASAPNVIVGRQSSSISNLPEIVFGSMPRDNGHLVLSSEEKDRLIENHPESRDLIKRYMGSQEFIRGEERFCLWITEDQKELAFSISEISNRLSRVATMRRESNALSTQQYADRPYMFVQRAYQETRSIIVPSVSSERREYIPIGFLDADTVISNLAFAIYYAADWVFGVVTSRMHMVWVRAVAGRLEERIRYSSQLCYNTFPFPQLSERQKGIIEDCVDKVLSARAYHGGKTMAQIYDPDKMPDNLREAHTELDLAIERLYRSRPFESDEERLAYLFDLYGKMTKTK